MRLLDDYAPDTECTVVTVTEAKTDRPPLVERQAVRDLGPAREPFGTHWAQARRGLIQTGTIGLGLMSKTAHFFAKKAATRLAAFVSDRKIPPVTVLLE
jgi:hypothetical protein